MSYARKSLQILGGGYSALPPVDKVPATDYLLAQNWRSDALGRLISRPGYALQFSIAGAGLAHSAASAGGVSSAYYVGCNSAIVAPASSVYYNGSAVPIASGFDGNRIGFASQNGFMYVMNRGKQGRHSAGTGWQDWNIAAPKASPTVAAVATPATVGSATYFYALTGIPAYVHYLIIAGVSYSFLEGGITDPTIIPGQIASLASADPNCSVTYVGFGTNVVITPIVPAVVIPISGSDGNSPANLATGAITSLPNGTYQIYLTFQSADLTIESNPSPVSAIVTVVNSAITITIPPADAPSDSRVGFINAYATGGTLSNAYRVGQLPFAWTPGPGAATAVNGSTAVVGIGTLWVTGPAPLTVGEWILIGGSVYVIAAVPTDTSLTLAVPYAGPIAASLPYWTSLAVIIDSLPDLQATNNGVIMPTTHNAAPACAGVIGPQFGRLFAWSDPVHINRLYYTPANQPQYWNTDEQAGDWVDVGMEEERIVWCSLHNNLTIIYKERSIWMLIGDPVGGQLEPVYDGLGLANAFALAPAGQIDYFVAPNGLCLFDMAQVHVISGNILPLFNQSVTNAGPFTAPGSVLPGSAFNSTSLSSYAIALGHALGRLYIAYAEKGTGAYNLLVFDEGPEPERQAFVQPHAGRWFYHRNGIATAIGGFFGFYFDGTSMIGLTGAIAGAAQGFSLADFRGYLVIDPNFTPIECVYQSHYEDCGLPDNDKQWLEVAVDSEIAAGVVANVYAAFNNGNIAPVLLGTLTTGARNTQSFGFPVPPAADDGVLARNMSVLIDVEAATGLAVIHNVYLYYYVEARLAVRASSLPTDLGVGKVKECKELQLDIDATLGPATAAIISDMPGNVLAVQHSPAVLQGGRAVLKYPFAVTQGFLWQVALAALLPFRLYAVRLLMRVIGVYVEAYESAAGYVWDSMQVDLGNAEDKTFDQLRFDMSSDEISPFVGVHSQATVNMLTDLPGEAFVSRGTFVLTNGARPRAWVTVPLPDVSSNVAIEGRSLRLQTTGTGGYRLYKVQARYSRVGRYLAGSTPSGNDDRFRTLEFDLNSERRNMFKRIEVDLRAEGIVAMSVITDQDGIRLAPVYAPALVTPNGRTATLVILPPGIRGRLLRISLTSPQSARIYGIRAWCRPVNEVNAAWKWVEFPLEASEILPTWVDLTVEETPPTWTWVDVPMDVTE